MTRYIKDPNAHLDYGQDWAPWLAQGEQITAHQVIIDPAGLTLDSSLHTTNKVIAWLSGGTDGAHHKVTYRITTDQGRTDDRTDSIHIQER